MDKVIKNHVFNEEIALLNPSVYNSKDTSLISKERFIKITTNNQIEINELKEIIRKKLGLEEHSIDIIPIENNGVTGGSNENLIGGPNRSNGSVVQPSVFQQFILKITPSSTKNIEKSISSLHSIPGISNVSFSNSRHGEYKLIPLIKNKNNYIFMDSVFKEIENVKLSSTLSEQKNNYIFMESVFKEIENFNLSSTLSEQKNNYIFMESVFKEIDHFNLSSTLSEQKNNYIFMESVFKEIDRFKIKEILKDPKQSISENANKQSISENTKKQNIQLNKINVTLEIKDKLNEQSFYKIVDMLSNLNTPQAKLYKTRILYFVLFFYRNVNSDLQREDNSNIVNILNKLSSKKEISHESNTNVMENYQYLNFLTEEDKNTYRKMHNSGINQKLIGFIKKA